MRFHLFQIAFSIFYFFVAPFSTLWAQDYEKAWAALSRNDRKTAREHFEKALNVPTTATDAALSLFLIELFDENHVEARKYFEQATGTMTNPYPYYYTLSKEESVVGENNLKDKAQFDLLKTLIEDLKCPFSLSSSARYTLSFHYMAEDNLKKMLETREPISNVSNWQFTGPFDNESESGFDKNYPPITEPKPEAKFRSLNNSDIFWMTPPKSNDNCWFFFSNNILWNTGIVYAQSFVNSPSDKEVFLGAGFSGNIKVWVNDRLLLSEKEIRKTDFDVYRVPLRLRKGNNRILVQSCLQSGEFSNFSLRFLEKDGTLVQGLTSSTVYAPYPKDSGPLPERLPHFAESFFEQKVREHPDNLLNHILLCFTYFRSAKLHEALAVVEEVSKKEPENSLINLFLLQCYSKLNNRTALSEKMEDIKRFDPDWLFSLTLRYYEAKENEQFDVAKAVLDKLDLLKTNNPSFESEKVLIALKQEKYDDAVRMIEKYYEKYPTTIDFVRFKHNVELNVRKNPNSALGIYEKFLSKNFDVSIALAVVEESFQLGQNERGLELLEKLIRYFPENYNLASRIVNYYHSNKTYNKARIWADKVLEMAPFHGNAWRESAKLAESMDEKKMALEHYKKSLHYNPNDFEVRRLIEDMEGKKTLDLISATDDAVQRLQNTKVNVDAGEYDWYYVQKESSTILHPERNSEQTNVFLVKILNEKGIDYWKESNIYYNDNRSRMIIEKAEVIKPNGSRIAAEVNDNQIVCPNLQVNDGVYIRYRISNYTSGRMSREFWETHAFNHFVPVESSKYTLFVSNKLKIQHKTLNCDIKPEITAVSGLDFQKYVWEAQFEAAIKDENFQPASADISKMLHVSTLLDWTEVSTWYGDISAIQAKADLEVKNLAKSLFLKDAGMSETQKAKAIYNWILENIRYSSVPFRQSDYVPQRAVKVIQTKLGDCKDMATLYASLAREAGLTANLVLLNTRDEGQQAMALPSMEFNHCIVKVIADGVTWYLELTDPDLPFGFLPNNDQNAFVLEVPFGLNSSANAEPFLLNPPNRLADFQMQKTSIEFNKRDMIISTDAVISGGLSGALRSRFNTLSQSKRMEEMQQDLSSSFNNTLSLKHLAFGDLNKLQDTLQSHFKFQVKNEVVEIGELQSFRIPFSNVFFKADAFPDEPRTFPVLYWQYENSDYYKEEISIVLPEGKTFVEVPKDVLLNFGRMTYKLTYTKRSGKELGLVREINVHRDDVQPKDYDKFRKFVEDVVYAEGRMLAFK